MINIEINLSEVSHAVYVQFGLAECVVHSAHLTSITPVGDQIVIKGIVIYEYHCDMMDEVIYMAYGFERINGHRHIELTEALAASEGGFDMLEEAEALIPRDSVKLN